MDIKKIIGSLLFLFGIIILAWFFYVETFKNEQHHYTGVIESVSCKDKRRGADFDLILRLNNGVRHEFYKGSMGCSWFTDVKPGQKAHVTERVFNKYLVSLLVENKVIFTETNKTSYIILFLLELFLFGIGFLILKSKT